MLLHPDFYTIGCKCTMHQCYNLCVRYLRNVIANEINRSLKRFCPLETFGHQMKRVLMQPQWILCCLMWLFRLSYLACLKLRKSPSIPRGFSPDHHDGLHQLYSTVCGISEHLQMFGLAYTDSPEEPMGQHYVKMHLFRFMGKQS